MGQIQIVSKLMHLTREVVAPLVVVDAQPVVNIGLCVQSYVSRINRHDMWSHCGQHACRDTVSLYRLTMDMIHDDETQKQGRKKKG